MSTYYLKQNFKEKKQFLDPTKWRLYLGRTGYCASDKPYNPVTNTTPGCAGGNSTYPGILYQKEWYLNLGTPPLNLSNVQEFKNNNVMWFVDPTGGWQSYDQGAYNSDILISDTDEGLEIKSMKVRNEVAWPVGGIKPENESGLYNIASIRIESFDIYNGGLFVLDATQIPSGCGIWPAFWLASVEDVYSWQNPSVSGGGYNSNWPL
jgi:hypothetical protein